MASTRQCLLNQFADLSVRANQNNFNKNSILVSDLRIYLCTFNLGGQSASSGEHLPSNTASVGRGEERDYIGAIRRRSKPPQQRASNPSLHRLLPPPGGGCPQHRCPHQAGGHPFTVTPLGPSSAAQTRVNASLLRVTRSRS